MVLHCHFGGVFHLIQIQTVHLGKGGRSHGTGGANLGLTATFRARNRGGALCQAADNAGSGKTTEDYLVIHMTCILEILQHSWQNTAGAASGSGNDGTIIGVLFGNRIGIGTDNAAFPHLGNFRIQLLLIQVLRFALYTQTAGQSTGGI